MSTKTGTAPAGSVPPAADVRGADQAAGPAGRLFRQVTVLPTLLAAAWLVAGLPLLLLGHFTPLLMLVLWVPVAAVTVTLGMRWVSGQSLGLLGARGAAPGRTPWWALVALVAVAVAFGVDQFAYHSQYVLIARDPGAYLQFANWISRHGSLPIPEDAAAFGGHTSLLSFSTPAFYQVGNVIVPQFMAGLPMLMSAAFWIGGVNLAVATNTVLGACGLLAFGGLVGRLVGPRWAPLGALVLAVSWPQEYTSRETFSEPLAQILFLGGLCLLIDSFTPEGAVRRGLAALAGLAVGLTLVVRIDGASDMLPLIPYCGLLVLGRRRQAWPLVAGLVAGAAYGAVDGLVLSRPYVASVRAALIPLTAFGFLVLAGTALAVLKLWHRGVPALRTNWLPNAAAAAAFVVTIALVIRPYVQTSTQAVTRAAALAMAQWQRQQGLPVQPTRNYYEISLHWVFWYVGVPVVVLATVGAALLARRCLHGTSPAWTLPLASFAWIIVTTLVRPAIVADQPWASRRLVPAVLPGFVLLALWAASWLLGWLRQRGAREILVRGGAVVLGALVVLPGLQTTFDFQWSGTGLTAVGMAGQRAYQGEIAAVSKLCAALPAKATVLFVGGAPGGQFAPAVRGTCGEPAALVRNPDQATLDTLVTGIRRAGRRPVLVGGTKAAVTRFASQVTHLVSLNTRADAHTLVSPPVRTSPLTINVWISEDPK